MAGGKGTRLKPYTATFPKPLMPIGETPILELLLGQLKRAGVDEAILAVGHLRHLIEAFFGDGERFGLRVSYSFEDKPLGTAGPIAHAIERLGDRFVVTNGDLLTTLDMNVMMRDHADRGAAATIGTYRREITSDFGILEVDSAMRMTAYREKPRTSHLVSMGLYVLERAAVAPHLVPNTHLDMPDLLRAMAGSGAHVHCHVQECFWLDIGRPEDFATAQDLWERDRHFLG